MAQEKTTIFTNASIVDGSSTTPDNGMQVLVRDGMIDTVTDQPIQAGSGRVIDLKGKTLMPGLIDCHAHVVATTVRLGDNALLPDSLVTAKSMHIMHGMLMRGFTTIRDLGGADFGLQQAVAEGLILGPRLVICGKGFSQSGGHSDFRGRYDHRPSEWLLTKLGALGAVVDGIEPLRAAIRNQIRSGGQFVKLMANGGVASPTDPVNFFGYSQAEIKMAVEEAAMAQTYVAGHLYTAESIQRGIECGIESIEHATLVNDEAARAIKAADAVAVPTLIVFESFHKHGASLGLPEESIAKLDGVRLPGLESLETLRAAGVTMGFGSDLLGALHKYQSDEFLLRDQVLPTHEVIRSATLDAAKVVRMEGQIGCISPGAFADLIVVDGNPLEDISLLTRQGAHMPVIMKEGTIIKNDLH